MEKSGRVSDLNINKWNQSTLFSRMIDFWKTDILTKWHIPYVTMVGRRQFEGIKCIWSNFIFLLPFLSNLFFSLLTFLLFLFILLKKQPPALQKSWLTAACNHVTVDNLIFQFPQKWSFSCQAIHRLWRSWYTQTFLLWAKRGTAVVSGSCAHVCTLSLDFCISFRKNETAIC